MKTRLHAFGTCMEVSEMCYNTPYQEERDWES